MSPAPQPRSRNKEPIRPLRRRRILVLHHTGHRPFLRGELAKQCSNFVGSFEVLCPHSLREHMPDSNR
jgi:hypothetical protein